MCRREAPKTALTVTPCGHPESSTESSFHISFIHLNGHRLAENHKWTKGPGSPQRIVLKGYKENVATEVATDRKRINNMNLPNMREINGFPVSPELKIITNGHSFIAVHI